MNTAAPQSDPLSSTPAREHPPQNITELGLGLGLPSSFGGTNQLTPQTPQRGVSTQQSPRPSPSGLDRTGQIGLGELATPRWSKFGNARRTDSSPWVAKQTPSLADSKSSSQSSTYQHRHVVTAVTSSMTHSAASLRGAKQRDATMQRHSRAISLTSTASAAVAQRSPSGPTPSYMVTSPSMPAHDLTGLSSISSLRRDFGDDPTGYMRSLQEMSGPNRGLDSPPYSINALSESDSSMAHGSADELLGLKTAIAQSRSKELQTRPIQTKGGGHRASLLASSQSCTSTSSRSPRIGDLPWSGAEIGPFEVSLSQQEANANSILGRCSEDTEILVVEADPHSVSEADYRGSFDLNTAIADLLRDDEERRQRRKDLGIESDTESRRSSAEPARLTEGQIDKVPSQPSVTQANASHASAPRRLADGHNRLKKTHDKSAATAAAARAGTSSPTATQSARTRHSSSPGFPLSSTSHSQKSAVQQPSLPDGSSAVNATASNVSLPAVRPVKRGSSASILHTLLRSGVVPHTASTDNGGEAAEALRRLDGIGASRRRSSSRERPSADSISLKSPQTSKSYSRPGSASKGGSRPSSPAMNASRNQRNEQLQNQARSDRHRSSEDSRARRSSRNLSRPRIDELGGSSPKISLDSPTISSFSSPRARKSVLPPLPTASMPPAAGTSTTTSPMPRTEPVSKRASIIYAASRDFMSGREPGGTPTTTSRLSTNSKTKRMSDASSHFSVTTDTQRSESTNEDDELRSSQTSHSYHSQTHGAARSGAATNLIIPPVPPLPKAWEASRSGSNTNIGLAVGLDICRDDSLSLHSAGFNETNASHNAPEIPYRELPMTRSSRVEQNTTSRPTSQSATRKWSFSNLSSALGRSPLGSSKRSDEQLMTGVGRLPQSPMLAQGAPKGRLQTQTTHEHSHNFLPQTSKASHDESSLLRGNQRTRSNSASKVPSPTPLSRTPSLFRKKGADHCDVSVVSPSQPGGNSFAVSKTPPPAAGRLSRKSILGLGSLLRNSASRKSVQLSARDESLDQLSTVSSLSTSEFGVRVDPSATGAPVKTSRRSSLIGRKRGKTLPSSAEPPMVAPNTLPPIQVAPIANHQPVSQILSQDVGMDAGQSRRRLVNSTSAGDLSGSAKVSAAKISSTEQHPVTPSARRGTAAANAMPTIQDNSPAGAQSAQLFPSASSSCADEQGNSGNAGTASNLPASRIPRATGSIRRTPLRAGAAEIALGNASVTSSGSFSTRRLSSFGNSALPQMSKSSTMASLASNFGIHGSEEKLVPLPGAATTSQNDMNSSEPSKKSPAAVEGKTSPPTVISKRLAPNLVSSSVQSILKAYNVAKSSSEAEGALRRARITAYSSSLSPTDREALNSLFARHEQSTKMSSSATVSKRENAAGVNKTVTSDGTTSSTRAARRLSNAAPISKDSMPPSSSTAFATASLPRRVRASVTASSSSVRTAREAALTSAKETRRTLSRNSPTGTATTQESRSVSSASSVLDEEERAGDEEMEAYIRRSHAKKLAAGVSQAELDKMLRFPEPDAPSKAYSPRQAEALYSNQLCEFELAEMFEYKQIYFVGNPRSKVMATRDKSANNHGYDDERGDYVVVERDHLAYRYEIVGTLGRGSFGQVLQCKDHKTGKSVAIKLIRNKKRFHHQALVEVKILQNLVDWDPDEQYNVIKMTDSFYFRNHLCISMELLSINLYELIKANSFAGFTTALIRRFTSQVLMSLSLMRQHHVVHCDLKPENILLKHPRKSAIKVIDFGSSCFEHEKVYTYIQSRFYRSPEVILGMNYHTAIDVWSLGCILAELYTGYPLFPGENEQEQLACIMEILGTPDRYLIDRASRKKLFFDSTGSPRPYVSAKGKRRRPATKTLGQALKCGDELFLDFLARCLIWDPERRIKPEAALRHAWIRSGGVGTHLPSASHSSGSSTQKVIGVTNAHVRQPSLSLRSSYGTGTGALAASSSSLSSSSATTTAHSSQAAPRTARASLLTSTAGARTTAASQQVGITAGGVGGTASSLSSSSRRTSLHGGSSAQATSTTSIRRNQQQQQPVS